MTNEYEQLLENPAVQAAIAMQREAERLWVTEPEKHPDPQLWCAVMTVIAFARAGGDCDVIRALTAGMSREVGPLGEPPNPKKS